MSSAEEALHASHEPTFEPHARGIGDQYCTAAVGGAREFLRKGGLSRGGAGDKRGADEEVRLGGRGVGGDEPGRVQKELGVLLRGGEMDMREENGRLTSVNECILRESSKNLISAAILDGNFSSGSYSWRET